MRTLRRQRSPTTTPIGRKATPGSRIIRFTGLGAARILTSEVDMTPTLALIPLLVLLALPALAGRSDPLVQTVEEAAGDASTLLVLVYGPDAGAVVHRFQESASSGRVQVRVAVTADPAAELRAQVQANPGSMGVLVASLGPAKWSVRPLKVPVPGEADDATGNAKFPTPGDAVRKPFIEILAPAPLPDAVRHARPHWNVAWGGYPGTVYHQVCREPSSGTRFPIKLSDGCTIEEGGYGFPTWQVEGAWTPPLGRMVDLDIRLGVVSMPGSEADYALFPYPAVGLRFWPARRVYMEAGTDVFPGLLFSLGIRVAPVVFVELALGTWDSGAPHITLGFTPPRGWRG